MKFEGYPEFGFDIEQIKNHLENLSNISEEYSYLAKVNNSLKQAHEAGHKIPRGFIEWFNKTLSTTSRAFQTEQKKLKDYPLFNFNVEEIEKYFNEERNIANKCMFLIDVLRSSLDSVQQGKKLPDAFKEFLLVMVDTGLFNLEQLRQQTLRALAEAKQSVQGPNEQSVQEPSEQVEKIQWLGNDVDLAYLFDLLIKDGFLSEEKKYKQIEQHFITKKGKPFDNEKLSSNYAKVANRKGKSKNASILEEIVSEVKTPSKR
jgi:Zn-dependent M32 family carboxypeptidase